MFSYRPRKSTITSITIESYNLNIVPMIIKKHLCQNVKLSSQDQVFLTFYYQQLFFSLFQSQFPFITRPYLHSNISLSKILRHPGIAHVISELGVGFVIMDTVENNNGEGPHTKDASSL